MKRDLSPFDSELETLLERGRIIRPVSDVVRARALARARATVAAAAVVVPATPARWGRVRMAVAAGVALALGAAGATAALHGRVPRPEPTPPASSRAVPPVQSPTSDVPAEPTIAGEPISIAKAQRPARSAAAAQESYAAELELLQRAQAAYAGRDFAGGLLVLAEHSRRFPNGRLSEEREALRVRSLVGSGRGNEARRAVAAFAHRFPRSVLLPRLQETANGAE